MGLNAEERLVYQLVEQAGHEGIWIKHLKQRSNVPQTRIPRIIQTLEKRKLIKAVKTAEVSVGKEQERERDSVCVCVCVWMLCVLCRVLLVCSSVQWVSCAYIHNP
jgi:hypothetical protein